MEKYIKINSYRKQLQYIDKILDILQDDEDGGLFENFTEEEENKFVNFMDFIIDIESNVKNKLKKVEVK